MKAVGVIPGRATRSLSLKMKDFDVTSFGKENRPLRNLDLLEELCVRYISTSDLSIREAAKRFGPFDLMFEATGYSPVAFEAMECLGKNGVLVLARVTGGDRDPSVPADKINLDFVLGNKLVIGTVNAIANTLRPASTILHEPSWNSQAGRLSRGGADTHGGTRSDYGVCECLIRLTEMTGASRFRWVLRVRY